MARSRNFTRKPACSSRLTSAIPTKLSTICLARPPSRCVRRSTCAASCATNWVRRSTARQPPRPPDAGAFADATGLQRGLRRELREMAEVQSGLNGKPRFSRILLKLSGQALAPAQGSGLDLDALAEIALEIKEVAALGVQLALVIGAGNFIRGSDYERSEEHTSELQSLRQLVCRLSLL